MISLPQYAGIHANNPDFTLERQGNAIELLSKVNVLLTDAQQDGIEVPINPKTGSQVSGETFGGFRPQNCPIGAPDSTHKIGRGIDIFDPDGKLDAWCMTHKNTLKSLGLCMEHPDSTLGWCHLQDRPVPSGNVVFYP